MSAVPVSVAALIERLAPLAVVGDHRQRSISHISDDSRTVAPGGAFATLKGQHVDGERFLGDALTRGACVALTHSAANTTLGALGGHDACLIRVADPSAALSAAAALVAGEPSRRLRVAGVTGTAGKSTTCRMIHDLLGALGTPAGLISTSGVDTGSGVAPNRIHVTTPPAPLTHRLLAEMVAANLDAAVVEASSHGLSTQTRRLDDVSFDGAVVTNVSHDHLEFHGTPEAYLAAKASLVARLPNGAPAVLHTELRGTAAFVHAATAAAAQVAWFGDEGDCRIANARFTAAGAEFDIHLDGARLTVAANLRYPFDLDNCAAAVLTVARLTGAGLDEVADGIAGLTTPPGRTTEIAAGQPFRVVVDYAHNPAEMEAMLRGHAAAGGRRIVVFGSAGERDVAKRRLQGEIADRLADLVILTEEDDRDEDPAAIAADIAAGCSGKVVGETLLMVPDREEAIGRALDLAQPGDEVLLLGKGHEASIIGPGGRERTWDERAAAERALAARGWRDG